ncbi:MAG: Ig-like domain-containing protein [Caldilineaceae bacterium]
MPVAGWRNLLADNGNGADADPDGTDLRVAGVNGTPVDGETLIALPSGAMLTVQPGGGISYDPNGLFGTGDRDGFSYTITDQGGACDRRGGHCHQSGPELNPVLGAHRDGGCAHKPPDPHHRMDAGKSGYIHAVAIPSGVISFSFLKVAQAAADDQAFLSRSRGGASQSGGNGARPVWFARPRANGDISSALAQPFARGRANWTDVCPNL